MAKKVFRNIHAKSIADVCVDQGWANFSHEEPHTKKFEAEGRTD